MKAPLRQSGVGTGFVRADATLPKGHRCSPFFRGYHDFECEPHRRHYSLNPAFASRKVLSVASRFAPSAALNNSFNQSRRPASFSL